MIHFVRTYNSDLYSEVHKFQALWRAVINEAMNDLLNPLKTFESFEAKREIMEWIKSENFILVCIYAGFEPDYIRVIFKSLIKTLRTKKFRESTKTKIYVTSKEKQKWRKYSQLKKYQDKNN